MADVDTIEAAIAAEAAGADLIATTLTATPPQTQHLPALTFTAVQWLNSPAISEGGISTGSMLPDFRSLLLSLALPSLGIDHQVKRLRAGVGSGSRTTLWLKLINKL